MDPYGLHYMGALFTGLDWTGLDSGLDWTGLDWTGLDWTGLDWTGVDLPFFDRLYCGTEILKLVCTQASFLEVLGSKATLPWCGCHGVVPRIQSASFLSLFPQFFNGYCIAVRMAH